MRVHGGVVLEPVEDVDGVEGAFLRETVRRSVTFGSFDGILALVKHMDVRRARAGRVQAESTEEAEAIQHLSAFAEFRHGLIIRLLVEIHARLVTADEVGLEF